MPVYINLQIVQWYEELYSGNKKKSELNSVIQ